MEIRGRWERPSSDDLGEKMEAVEEALRKAMEKKDKLAILTGVYTGGGEKVWVFYTRTVRVFGERLDGPALFGYCHLYLYRDGSGLGRI